MQYLDMNSFKNTTGVTDLSKYAKPFHFDQNRAETDRLLVRLHLVVNRIYSRAFPPLSSGELHGLPEEITEGAWEDRPIAMNPNKPEWEFNSWFHEKTSDMRRFTDSAFDHFGSPVITVLFGDIGKFLLDY